MSFADLEQRANATVLARLSNAVCSINGGAPFDAMFDNAYALAGVGPYGMASTRPVLTMATASVPAAPVGMACVVGAVAYTVAEHQPNGTGISLLYLEAAA